MHNIRLLLNYNLNLYDDSELVIRCGSSENIPSNPNSKALDKSEELLTVKERIAKLLFRAQETFFLSALFISMCNPSGLHIHIHRGLLNKQVVSSLLHKNAVDKLGAIFFIDRNTKGLKLETTTDFSI